MYVVLKMSKNVSNTLLSMEIFTFPLLAAARVNYYLYDLTKKLEKIIFVNSEYISVLNMHQAVEQKESNLYNISYLMDVQ